MYCEYFGFSIAPFNNTPDPRFFFNSQDHEEALASLIYCATERKGFVLVTGEIGSGKTLLSRLLISRLPAGTRSAVITNTRLSGVELLRSICSEFSLDVTNISTAAELGRALEKFLLEQYARDRLAVLILDEAQNLPPESFEEIRMLGNLEADNAKLLQILVLGQPELQETFRRPDMRQLHQRVCRTFHLRELSLKLTGQYIEHRLAVAGHDPAQPIFGREAYDRIHHHSEGIPRLINQICDNALLAAYTDSIREVKPALIDEVVAQMMSLTEPRDKRRTRGTLARELEVGRQTIEDRGEPPERRLPPTNDAVLRDLMDRLAISERKQVDLERRTLARSIVDPESMALQPGALRSMHESAVKMVQEAQNSAKALRDELDRMRAETRTASEQATRDVAASIAAGKQDTEALRSEIMRMWDSVRADSEKQSKQVEELLKRDREQFAGARTQIDELNGMLTLRSREVKDRADELTGFVRSQGDVTSRQLAELEGRTNERVNKMAEALDGFMRETQSRMDQTHSRMADITTAAEAEVKRAREALSEARDKIVAEADGDRRNAARVLGQTQELLSKTREQTTTFLAGFDARVMEEVRNTEATCHKAISESDQALSTLRNRLAETRTQAERSRESLETLIQTATAEFAEARAALNSEMSSHHSEVSRSRDDVTVLRSEIGRQIGAMRDELTDATDSHRRQMLDFRQESAALLHETNSTLTAANIRARRTADEIQLELNQAIASLQSQSKELRTQSDAQLVALRDCVGDSVTKGQGRLDLLRQKISDLSRDATNSINDLQSRVDTLRADVRATLDVSEGRIREQSSDAENRVAEATGKCRAIVAELTSLQTTAGAELRSLRDDLSGREDGARAVAARMADELATATSRASRIIDDLQTRVSETLESATEKVTLLGGGAEHIYTRLAESVEILERRASECRASGDEESARLQHEMNEVIERNRRAIEEAETQVETLVRQASTGADEFSKKLQLIRQSSQNGLSTVSQQIRDCLAAAAKDADRLKTETETTSKELSQRADDIHVRSSAAVEKAEQAVEAIAEQSRSSLAEVRSGLMQMTERSSTLQRDFTRLGADLRESATTAIEQVRSTAGGVTAQIEALREGAQRDAESHQRKMASLRQQVETGAEQIRGSASRLLDQVQSGAASIREHAEKLLKQAQGGAATIGDQAERLLSQAQETADRFNEQAESILRRSEATAEAMKTDLTRLRSEVLQDVDKVQEQMLVAKREMGESRQESSDALRQAVQAHRTAQADSQALLKRADDVQEQTVQLMHMPRELVGEARKNAQLLKDMSGKIAMVIRQLSDANGKAQASKHEVAEATASADQRLVDLRKHTEQVAKLVAIIRQLYGAMDQRIDRLRDRLTSADEIARSVPREIASLKAVLNSEALHAQSTLPAAPLAFRAEVASPPRRPVTAPPAAASTPGKTALPRKTPAVSGTQADSLAAVVQKNKKLNEWLQKTLVAEAAAEKTPGANRVTGIPAKPRSIPAATPTANSTGVQPSSAA